MQRTTKWFLVAVLALPVSWGSAGELAIMGNVAVNSNLTAGSFAGDGVRLTNLVSGMVKASLYGSKDDSTLRALTSTTNQIELIIDGGVWEITSDLTLSNNVALSFAPGSMFNIHEGKTITINGPINCGIQQIVDGDVGGFDWVYPGRAHTLPVEWIGVKSQAIGYELLDAAQATRNVEKLNDYLAKGEVGLTFGVGCYFIDNPIMMRHNSSIGGVEPTGFFRGGHKTQIIAAPNFPFDDPLKPMIFAGVGAEQGQFSSHLVQNVSLVGENRPYAGIIFTGPQEGDGARNVHIDGCRRRGIEVYPEKNGRYNGPAENFALENLHIAATPDHITPDADSTHFIGIALRDPCSREVVRNVTIAGTYPECQTLTDLTNSIATATDCYAWAGLTNPLAPSTVFPTTKRYGIVMSGITAMSVSIEDIHTEGFDCGILNLSQCALSIKNYSGSICFCDIYQDYQWRYVDMERGGGLTIEGFGANAQFWQRDKVSYSLVDRISNYIKPRRIYPIGEEWLYAIPFYSSDMQTRKCITMESSELASMRVVPNPDDVNYPSSYTNNYSAVRAQPKASPIHPGHIQNTAYEVMPTTVHGGDVRARTFGLYIPEIRTEASGYLVGNQNAENGGQQAGIRIDSISSSQALSTVAHEWRNYGIWIKSLSGGHGTWSQYGLRIDDVSGSEYDDYGVYIAGGDKNYFATNVGIGTSNPVTTLDVNGSLRVSGGTAFNRMQGGTFSVGSNSVGFCVCTAAFPVAFSGAPKVTCTPRQSAGESRDEAFMSTVRSVSTTNFVVNIKRGDASGGWLSNLQMDWFAWE